MDAVRAPWRSAVRVCGSGADLDGPLAAAVRTTFLIVQPMASSIQRLTASPGNSMVRWASIESRLW